MRCGRCENNCQLTVSIFPGGRRFITGNRCEKGAGIKLANKTENMYEYKLEQLEAYGEKKPHGKPIARVGIPMALSYYDMLPFFHTMLTELGFEVVLSDESSRDTYYRGQQTIPSDTVCYPAKLAHGHILNLLDKGVDFIF